MPNQRYSVTPHSVDSILGWVREGVIAIPEIQRPFVWEPTKVRNLLDSLYQGFPIGYLITWCNPTVKLKDGTLAAGKRVLIDGQQRVTALMAALLGQEVLTKDYETVRIRIAFNPEEERFEVANPAIDKDPAWIPDVADVFAPGASIIGLLKGYAARNRDADQERIGEVIERLRAVTANQVGVIDLDANLDIETVTEVFIRVNSAGATLSQADFAMSKIAANESYGGNVLRKAIDYFCHAAVAPDFVDRIKKVDKQFAESHYYKRMAWLAGAKDDLYDPTYSDMLRVAFTSEFGRGRLGDLVALLSGRNFETRQFEDEIAAESFARLAEGVLDFMRETNFEQFTMIIRAAGFVTSDLIGSQNAVNFAYILYLRGRAEKMKAAALARIVRRWYAMSVLRGRYTGSFETAFDTDVRQLEDHGLASYANVVIEAELPQSFWTGMLPQLLETSSPRSPYFLAFKAAQVKAGDRAFLSRDTTVRELLLHQGDVHHVYPCSYLKRLGFQPSQYNQVANFVLTETGTDISISGRPPCQYFAELAEQCSGGPLKYGDICDEAEMRANLEANCVPVTMLGGTVPDYEDFLAERRVLMAAKIKTWFESL